MAGAAGGRPGRCLAVRRAAAALAARPATLLLPGHLR